jgi:maleylpyruvate isomerase
MTTSSSVHALPQFHETILATTRYLEGLTTLTDDDCHAPSVLPGWTRGHVITHVARNADALTNLLHSAQSETEIPMYPSQEARDSAVQAGAGRTADELREDAAASWGRLLQAANELHVSHLDARVVRTPGDKPFPVSKVGGMRRTEVEIHHADLQIGYTAADWPADFTRYLLERRARELAATPMRWRLTDTGGVIDVGEQADSGPEIVGPSAELAWWLIGRGTGEALESSTGSLPELGRWL